MLAKLSDGWRTGLKISFVLAASLAVGLLVWFILSDSSDDEPAVSPDSTENAPLPLDGVGNPDAPIALDSAPVAEAGAGTDSADGLVSKGVLPAVPEFSWSGWQLMSIDGAEISPAGDVTVRCRAMSTDRIPNAQVISQLVYQIGRSGQSDPADFHVSQINNYYRCDLDLEWSAIIVGYEPGVCLDLDPLNGALSLTTGREDEAKEHPALAPWIGAGCSADPGLAGRISIELSQAAGQPTLAEVIYEGTFRVFVPKNDYSKIIWSIRVDIEPGVWGILEPVRIERL